MRLGHLLILLVLTACSSSDKKSEEWDSGASATSSFQEEGTVEKTQTIRDQLPTTSSPTNTAQPL